MKKMICLMSLMISAMMSAQTVYASCATHINETGPLEKSVEAIRKGSGLSHIGLGSQFTEIDGKGRFRIFADRNGNLFLDAPYGKFETTICGTSKGIEAHVPLDGMYKMMAGLDVIVFTLTGENGRLKLTTNKEGEAPAFYTAAD